MPSRLPALPMNCWALFVLLSQSCLSKAAGWQVYRGCLDGKTDVAIKFLHSYRLENKDLQAFLTEVAVLHTCRHACIVELKGCLSGGGKPSQPEGLQT